MQKPIKFVDYRDIFNFEVTFPVLLEYKKHIKPALESYALEGGIVTFVDTDKEGEMFSKLKQDLGEDGFNKTEAIIFGVKIIKPLLA